MIKLSTEILFFIDNPIFFKLTALFKVNANL
jgi:hypothetical protein